MTDSFIAIMTTILLYLLGMILIGVLYSRKNKDVSDFYLGGRKLGPLVTAMSAEASDMSSWLLMGLPGVAYLTGGAEAGWTAIGLAIGTYLNWLFVAKRLSVYSKEVKAITVPDFFSARYHDEKNLLRGIAAVIILVFFIPYTASGFSACGKLFESLFDLDYHWAMILSAIIIISYTSAGGFLAASFTDLIQSIVMTVALISILVFGVSHAGGFSNVIENAKSMDGYFSLFTSYNTATGSADSYTPLTIASTLAWGLGYFGMPHVLLRFMATADKKKLKTSRRIATIWVVISMAVAIFIGFVGNQLSANGMIDVLEKTNSERVIIQIALKMSEYSIPLAVVAGLVFAGIFACTMSTSDSQLLAASSSMSEDLIKGVFKKKIDAKKSMMIARGVLIAIAILGVILAWNPKSSVFRVVSFAWAGFGATFGPVMLLALFWKRSTREGAAAGMAVGGIMVFLWKFVIANLGGVFAIYELLPAFVFALIADVVVSLATKPNQEVEKEFENILTKIDQ